MLDELSEEGLDVGAARVLGLIGSHQLLHLACDERDALLGGCSATSRDDVHVDQTSNWISGCLLSCNLYQVYRLLHIISLHDSRQSHLGKCLTETDQGLKLTWSSSDSLLIGA